MVKYFDKNKGLFLTARIFTKENKANTPYYSIIIMAGLAAILAIIGSLDTLVDAAFDFLNHFCLR